MIVDIHSHVFNADDLPIDGFVRKLFPTPKLLTGVVSLPLDRLSQRAAPPDELERLLRLLGPEEGVEALEPVVEEELVSDEELARTFEAEWQRLGLLPEAGDTGGLEATRSGASDEQLAEALSAAPRAEVYELEAWLEEWDPALRETAALEGFGDVIDTVRNVKRAVSRFLAALRLVTRYRYQVAAELARTYPPVSLFVPALVDFAQTTSDNPSTDLREQIAIHSLVSKVSIAGRLPGAADTRLAPFVGFDPYREVAETALSQWNPDRGVKNTYVPYADLASTHSQDRYHRGIRFDESRARPLQAPESSEWESAFLDLAKVNGAMDLARHAIELGGFVGVKLYPPAGFLPLGNALRFGGTKGEQLDAALRALYGYCAEMDVPILAHASHSNGFEEGYDAFAGPAGWELVLAEYPELRVCFGHFGHLHGVGADPAQASSDGWPSRFVELMDRHVHVYADVGNSKFPLSDSYRTQYLALVSLLLGGANPDPPQAKRRRRLLYGSDFWMNTLSPRHDAYLTGFETAFRETFDGATVEGFMGRNALRFLGFTGEDDRADLSNRNRQRFVAFHGPHDTPEWLQRKP